MFDKASLDRLFEELRDEFELETDWEEIQRDAHLALAYADVGVLGGKRESLDARSVDFVERRGGLITGHAASDGSVDRGTLSPRSRIVDVVSTEERTSEIPDVDPKTLAHLTFAEIEAVYGEAVAISAGIANDDDAWVLSSEDLARARPTTEVLPHLAEVGQKGVGKLPPKTPIEKVNVELTLDSDVIEFFKYLDPDWRNRLNSFLRVIIFRKLPDSSRSD